jgi:hypothetical protein
VQEAHTLHPKKATFGGFDMTEAEFFEAALRNQQAIQEILSFVAGIITALIVAVVWKY